MAQLAKKKDIFLLSFTDSEAKELGAKGGAWYELSKAREGIWVLSEYSDSKAAQGAKAKSPDAKFPEPPADAKPVEKPAEIDELAEKIIGMIAKLPPRERMEDWFEKKLSEAEKAKLKELLASGRVVKFKSSEVFRKALYTVPKSDPRPKIPTKFDNAEKPFQDFTLEKDGFVVVKNEERAKALGGEFHEKIKAGEIKGTRAFSGEFFIIYTSLLEATELKVLEEVKKAKSCGLAELSEKLKLIPTLIRIALEFLKEEGQVIEKRKDIYQYIR